MTVAFILVVAVLTTVISIPVLSRVAYSVGLIDYPDERKVHSHPVPRSGGLGIFLGTAIGTFVWFNPDPQLITYLCAALVLVGFGLWDDRSNIDYRLKLAGQALAAVIIMVGGTMLNQIPFWSIDDAPVWLSIPFTFFFIVGLTNAINLSDGLDGLAAGCSLITLCMVAIIGYPMGLDHTVVIVFALVGAILGFLRFNSHPATIFLGDTGSQFLGFSTAVVVIQLIDQVRTLLSPSLIFLLVGLPIIDTLWVMADRMLRGQSPFKADKRHLHHRLLNLGLQHYQAVGFIYLIHLALVGSAYLLAYYPDHVPILLFASVGMVTVGLVAIMERSGWSAHDSKILAVLRRVKRFGEAQFRRYSVFGLHVLAATVCAILVVGSVVASEPPTELSYFAIGLLAFYLLATRFWKNHESFACRVAVFFTAVMLIYLFNDEAGDLLSDQLINAAFWTLLAFTVIGFYFLSPRSFMLTSTDVLVLFVAIVVPILSELAVGNFRLTEAALQLVIFFYASEFLIFATEGGRSLRVAYKFIGPSVVLALSVLTFRSLVL